MIRKLPSYIRALLAVTIAVAIPVPSYALRQPEPAQTKGGLEELSNALTSGNPDDLLATLGLTATSVHPEPVEGERLNPRTGLEEGHRIGDLLTDLKAPSWRERGVSKVTFRNTQGTELGTLEIPIVERNEAQIWKWLGVMFGAIRPELYVTYRPEGNTLYIQPVPSRLEETYLVVDDKPRDLERIVDELKLLRPDAKIFPFQVLAGALETLATMGGKISGVISDYNLGADLTGVDFFHEARQAGYSGPFSIQSDVVLESDTRTMLDRLKKNEGLTAYAPKYYRGDDDAIDDDQYFSEQVADLLKAMDTARVAGLEEAAYEGDDWGRLVEAIRQKRNTHPVVSMTVYETAVDGRKLPVRFWQPNIVDGPIDMIALHWFNSKGRFQFRLSFHDRPAELKAPIDLSAQHSGKPVVHARLEVQHTAGLEEKTEEKLRWDEVVERIRNNNVWSVTIYEQKGTDGAKSRFSSLVEGHTAAGSIVQQFTDFYVTQWISPLLKNENAFDFTLLNEPDLGLILPIGATVPSGRSHAKVVVHLPAAGLEEPRTPTRPANFGQGLYQEITIGGIREHRLRPQDRIIPGVSYETPLPYRQPIPFPQVRVGTEISLRQIQSYAVPLSQLGRFSIAPLTFQIVPMGEGERIDQPSEDDSGGGVVAVAPMTKQYLLQVWLNNGWADLDMIMLEDGVPIVIGREDLPREIFDPNVEMDLEGRIGRRVSDDWYRNVFGGWHAKGLDDPEWRVAVSWTDNELRKTAYLPRQALSNAISRGDARVYARPGWNVATRQYIPEYLQTGQVQIEIMGDEVVFSDLGSTNPTAIEVLREHVDFLGSLIQAGQVVGDWLWQKNEAASGSVSAGTGFSGSDSESDGSDADSSQSQVFSSDESVSNLQQSLRDRLIVIGALGSDGAAVNPQRAVQFPFNQPFQVNIRVAKKPWAEMEFIVQDGILHSRQSAAVSWDPVHQNRYRTEEEVPVPGQSRLDASASKVIESYEILYAPKTNTVVILNHSPYQLQVVPLSSAGLEEDTSLSELQEFLTREDVTGGTAGQGKAIRGRTPTGIPGQSYDAIVFDQFNLQGLLSDLLRDLNGKGSFTLADIATGPGVAPREAAAKFSNLQPLLVDANLWTEEQYDPATLDALAQRAQEVGVKNFFSDEVPIHIGDAATVDLNPLIAPSAPLKVITMINALGYNRDPLAIVVNLFNQLEPGGVLLTNLYIPMRKGVRDESGKITREEAYPEGDRLAEFYGRMELHLKALGVEADFRIRDFSKMQPGERNSQGEEGPFKEYAVGILLTKKEGQRLKLLQSPRDVEDVTIVNFHVREVTYQVAAYGEDPVQVIGLQPATGLEETSVNLLEAGLISVVDHWVDFQRTRWYAVTTEQPESDALAWESGMDLPGIQRGLTQAERGFMATVRGRFENSDDAVQWMVDQMTGPTTRRYWEIQLAKTGMMKPYLTLEQATEYLNGVIQKGFTGLEEPPEPKTYGDIVAMQQAELAKPGVSEAIRNAVTGQPNPNKIPMLAVFDFAPQVGVHADVIHLWLRQNGYFPDTRGEGSLVWRRKGSAGGLEETATVKNRLVPVALDNRVLILGPKALGILKAASYFQPTDVSAMPIVVVAENARQADNIRAWARDLFLSVEVVNAALPPYDGDVKKALEMTRGYYLSEKGMSPIVAETLDDLPEIARLLGVPEPEAFARQAELEALQDLESRNL